MSEPWHAKNKPLQISNNKSCECGRTMSADDAHKRCQRCRNSGGYIQSPEYHAEWQRQDRAKNGRLENRS
jgi:hypothetical protein